jgi:hypothetical protein
MRRLSAIVCFFFVYAETGILKEREDDSLLCDISYVILKRRGDANRKGNSVTNAYVTRGP